MTKILIDRVYETQNHSKLGSGRIGVVTLACEISDVTLNGEPVAPAGVEHLLTFALQSFQDAYAGAADRADAVERHTAKLARVIAGTIGTHTRGEAEPAINRYIRAECRRVLSAAAKAEYKKLAPDARDDFLDAKFAAAPDATRNAITALAQARLDADIAAEKRTAALRTTITM